MPHGSYSLERSPYRRPQTRPLPTMPWELEAQPLPLRPMDPVRTTPMRMGAADAQTQLQPRALHLQEEGAREAGIPFSQRLAIAFAAPRGQEASLMLGELERRRKISAGVASAESERREKIQNKRWDTEVEMAERYGDPGLLGEDNPYGPTIQGALENLKKLPEGHQFIPGKGVEKIAKDPTVEKRWESEADLAERYADPTLMSPDNPYRAGVAQAVEHLKDLPEGMELTPGKGVGRIAAESGIPSAWEVEKHVGDLRLNAEKARGNAAKHRIWKREAEEQLGAADPMEGWNADAPLMSPDNPLRDEIKQALRGRALSSTGAGAPRPQGLATFEEYVSSLEKQADELDIQIRRSERFPRRGRGLPQEQTETPRSKPATAPKPKAGETPDQFHSRLTASGYTDTEADDILIDAGY